jgi:hypothetical protein
LYAGSAIAVQSIKWEYEGDTSGQWVPYDIDISACFEEAFSCGQQMLDLNSLFQLPYSIHFTTMQQVSAGLELIAWKVQRSDNIVLFCEDFFIFNFIVI